MQNGRSSRSQPCSAQGAWFQPVVGAWAGLKNLMAVVMMDYVLLQSKITTKSMMHEDIGLVMSPVLGWLDGYNEDEPTLDLRNARHSTPQKRSLWSTNRVRILFCHRHSYPASGGFRGFVTLPSFWILETQSEPGTASRAGGHSEPRDSIRSQRTDGVRDIAKTAKILKTIAYPAYTQKIAMLVTEHAV